MKKTLNKYELKLTEQKLELDLIILILQYPNLIFVTSQKFIFFEVSSFGVRIQKLHNYWIQN
jgi:hypothetical protein